MRCVSVLEYVRGEVSVVCAGYWLLLSLSLSLVLLLLLLFKFQFLLPFRSGVDSRGYGSSNTVVVITLSWLSVININAVIVLLLSLLGSVSVVVIIS